ncbi:peptidase S8 [Raphidocelis subcapitata]|uniref:Peptidase S8 n=1 Tax=Raphidocelis subcapitata TaxID=307507 RepID=A0A2V0NR82_9CHLO|nr:peptidase S8 [Raphidocelis subcapitata]|eukprot:GBF88063.1 peptidase S8 [Raphidocelis subcapitata]
MRATRGRPGARGVVFVTLAVYFAASVAASVVEDVEAKFYQDKAGQPIPGQWIVTFNDQVANSEEGLARLQEILTSPPEDAQAEVSAASVGAAAKRRGAGRRRRRRVVSAQTLGGPEAAAAPLRAAVLRLAPPDDAASDIAAASVAPDAAAAADAPPQPAAEADAEALLASGLVSRVEPDRYATIQQVQCVPGSALAGALPAAPHGAAPDAWPGCVGEGRLLVWFGERCGARFDKARYTGVYAVDRATGERVPGCVMVRNATKEFTSAWLGDCGAPPSLAATLPVSNICAPRRADAGKCVARGQLLSGVAVEVAAGAACGGTRGSKVQYRGSRCGPKGSLVQWHRYTVTGDAGSASCGRSTGRAKAAGAGPEEPEPLLANAEAVGACGVPPMIYKDLPTEVCAKGSGERPTNEAGEAPAEALLNLPKPEQPVATEPLRPKEELPWGIPRIEAASGGQVTAPLPLVVGVIDTGIDEGHPDLVVAGGKSWVSGEGYRDGNGHGTHVAGTIGAINSGAGVVGVAPGTPIFALRVLDARGSGAFSNIINALLWVAENGRSKGIRVINMSLGGDGGADPTSSAVCDAVKAVADAGIAVVAAAGNGGGGFGPRSWTSQLPVACPGTIAVTAIDSASNPATFSYFLSGTEAGKNDAARKRTVAAPGVDVKSTWPRELGMDYRTISGTSMASPHTAGVVAKCFAAGVCTNAAQAIEAVTAAASARNLGDEAYGFKGDPFFGRSRVGTDRYYGPMVHAGWRA